MENQIEKNLTHVHALLAKGEFMEAMETYLHDDVELREANGEAIGAWPRHPCTRAVSMLGN